MLLCSALCPVLFASYLDGGLYFCLMVNVEYHWLSGSSFKHPWINWFKYVMIPQFSNQNEICCVWCEQWMIDSPQSNCIWHQNHPWWASLRPSLQCCIHQHRALQCCIEKHRALQHCMQTVTRRGHTRARPWPGTTQHSEHGDTWHVTRGPADPWPVLVTTHGSWGQDVSDRIDSGEARNRIEGLQSGASSDQLQH